jgi:hypothetical protein
MHAPDDFSDGAGGQPPRHILTPSTLNRLVRGLLEDALPLVWIEGELSNVARPASGHLYFTLKDSAAQVRCGSGRGDAGSGPPPSAPPDNRCDQATEGSTAFRVW